MAWTNGRYNGLKIPKTPLFLVGYARYLKGIKDDGAPFDCSPDPILEELQTIVAPLNIGGLQFFDFFGGKSCVFDNQFNRHTI